MSIHCTANSSQQLVVFILVAACHALGPNSKEIGRGTDHEGGGEVKDAVNDKSNLCALESRLLWRRCLGHEGSSVAKNQVGYEALPTPCEWGTLQQSASLKQ